MQLNRIAAATDIEWNESPLAAGTPQNEMMREYESRRCHICQCRYPPFGFGVPLTKPGPTIWACFADRAEVEHLLNPRQTISAGTDEPRLL